MNRNTEQRLYGSRQEAWLALLATTELKAGNLYIRKYKKNLGNESDVLIAYAVNDCAGYPESLNSLKLIQGDSPIPVYSIFTYMPDVSELYAGQISLLYNKENSKVKYIYLESSESGNYSKTTIELGPDKKRFYCVTDGKFYYASGTFLREDGDYYSKEEMDNVIDEKIENGIVPDILELQRAVFPLSMNFSITPTVFEKGTSGDVTYTYSVSRKGKNVSNNCLMELKNVETGQVLVFNELKTIKNVNNNFRKFELKATYEPGFYISQIKEVNFYYKSYWGVINKSLLNGILEREDIGDLLSRRDLFENIEIRPKSTLTYSNIRLTLEDTVIYCYPSEYGNLGSIKDANGFEYLSDYTKTEVLASGIPYKFYYKITPTVITGFKQIFSF